MADIQRPHAAVPYVGTSSTGEPMTGLMREDPPGSGLYVPNVTETTEDD